MKYSAWAGKKMLHYFRLYQDEEDSAVDYPRLERAAQKTTFWFKEAIASNRDPLGIPDGEIHAMFLRFYDKVRVVSDLREPREASPEVLEGEVLLDAAGPALRTFDEYSAARAEMIYSAHSASLGADPGRLEAASKLYGMWAATERKDNPAGDHVKFLELFASTAPSLMAAREASLEVPAATDAPMASAAADVVSSSVELAPRASGDSAAFYVHGVSTNDLSNGEKILRCINLSAPSFAATSPKIEVCHGHGSNSSSFVVVGKFSTPDVALGILESLARGPVLSDSVTVTSEFGEMVVQLSEGQLRLARDAVAAAAVAAAAAPSPTRLASADLTPLPKVKGKRRQVTPATAKAKVTPKQKKLPAASKGKKPPFAKAASEAFANRQSCALSSVLFGTASPAAASVGSTTAALADTPGTSCLDGGSAITDVASPLATAIGGELSSPLGDPLQLAPMKLTDLLSPSLHDDDVSGMVDGGDGDAVSEGDKTPTSVGKSPGESNV